MTRDHFVRLGFLEEWKAVVPHQDAPAIFARLEADLNALAARTGALELTVPMAYIEGHLTRAPEGGAAIGPADAGRSSAALPPAAVARRSLVRRANAKASVPAGREQRRLPARALAAGRGPTGARRARPSGRGSRVHGPGSAVLAGRIRARDGFIGSTREPVKL